jgi:hypothetical protein
LTAAFQFLHYWLGGIISLLFMNLPVLILVNHIATRRLFYFHSEGEVRHD